MELKETLHKSNLTNPVSQHDFDCKDMELDRECYKEKLDKKGQ